MENRTEKSDRLIAEYYEEHRSSIFFYIYRRINDEGDAEDLVQDAFLRLLEHRMMIRPDTLKYFLFTIVRNLLNDYLRRYYKRQEIDRYLYDMLPVNRFQGKSSEDIAEELNLSRRTVENHLFISRKEVREFIRQCI